MRKKATKKTVVATTRDGPTVPLRLHVPKELLAKIEEAVEARGGAANKITKQTIILERLAKAFAVSVPAPRKGRRAVK